MKFGVILVQRYGTDRLIENAELAETVDFDYIGLGDSQSVFREFFTTAGLVADRTESVGIGPTVTTGVTRHPVVTASGMCTLDEISDGRAFCGLGSGDSAVYTLGKRPSKLAELEDVIELWHTLFDGEQGQWDGTEVKLRWLEKERQSYDIPIILGAEGPKTLNLCGRVADGTYIGTGLFPELIEDSIERVNEGAREAGRDPNDVEKQLLVKTNIKESREAAIEEIKMALAASANHAFRFHTEGKMLPTEYEAAIEEIQENYVPHQHEELGETKNKELLDRLEEDYPGLIEYLADRFTLVGTPEECRAKLREIEAIDGVDGVLLANLVHDDNGLVQRMGDEILTEFK